ncbi:MAG: hypothetical protein AMXMBFR13_16060 [Phycisphaerae bacterium]
MLLPAGFARPEALLHAKEAIGREQFRQPGTGVHRFSGRRHKRTSRPPTAVPKKAGERYW